MATTPQDFFADVADDPRIQSARARQAAPAPAAPTTPTVPPPPSVTPQPTVSNDFFADVATDPRIQKSAAPPATPPPGTTQPTEPGFLKGLWSMIDPIAMAKGIGEATAAEQQERESYAAEHPGLLNAPLRTLHGLGQDVKAFTGMATAPFHMAADIYWDAKQGRWATAAGKTVGAVGPMLLGARGAKVPKVRAAVRAAKVGQKAEREFQAMRQTLPGGTPADAQALAAETAKGELVGAYKQYEGARQSARQAAQARYGRYEKALSHPKNVEPPGLVIRDAVTNLEGDIIKPAVTTKAPWRAPVETEPFRTELQELIDLNNKGMFPAGHPIKKFFEALGGDMEFDPMTGEVTNIPKGGYKYVQFDDMKKALGKLSTFADSKGGPATPYQYLARQILDKARPVMMDKLKQIAKNTKVKGQTDAQAYRSIKNSLEGGDVEWAKYIQGFNVRTAPIKQARRAYVLDRAATKGKTPGVGAIPSIRSVEKAVSEIEPTERAAASAAKIKKVATLKSKEDLVRHVTSSTTNLDEYLKVNVGKIDAPVVLANLVDVIKETKDWGRWNRLRPEVRQRLTAYDPDLSITIPEVFKQLEEAEKLHGAQVTQGALARAVEAVQAAHKIRLGRVAIPKTVTAAADILSLMLQRQESARRLNQALRVQIARLPLTTKIARGATAIPPVTKAAEAIAPPEQERMAGD